MSALVPYRGATGVYRYVSATDVIRGTLPVDELHDKIVIVGTSAQGLLDLRATPVREDFPGVEVHANLVSGFLDQSIMHRPDLVLAISVLTVLLRSEERRVGKAGAPRSTLSNGNVVGRRDVMATKR